MLRMGAMALSQIMLVLILCQGFLLANGAPPSADVARVTADITYLASDCLEGRLPGTPGIEKAAEYIRDVFQNADLEPGDGAGGDYYQDFDITSGVTLGEGNALQITSPDGVATGVINDDFLPMFFSADGDVEGDVVFAGYGITSEQYGWDDYKEIDATGKIVFCLKDEPGKDNPDSPFDGVMPTSFSGLRWKAFNAKAHGAVALIIATGPMYIKEGKPDEFIGLDQTGGLGESAIPVIQIHQAMADKLFSTMGASLAMYQGEIERNSMAFASELKDIKVKLHVTLDRKFITTHNVAAVLRGSDPVKADEWVIVGAHYDHLGYGTDTSKNEGEREIHNGADDNASGTSGILELARMFASVDEKPARSILFLCFSAEEEGVLGSSAYLKNPLVPTENVTAMINMDMIGRVHPDENGSPYCSIHAISSAAEWAQIVPDKSPDGKVQFKSLPDPIGGGDYTNFYLAGLPVLNFFSGLHADYHKPSDDVDKINFDGEASVIGGIYEVVRKTADYPTKLIFQKGEMSSERFNTDVGSKVIYKVYLGTIPDFNRTEGGYFIAGASPGGPAETAGLIAGDQIIKLGDYDITDIYSYTYAMSNYKPGDTVDIVVMRDGAEVTMQVTFGARKG